MKEEESIFLFKIEDEESSEKNCFIYFTQKFQSKEKFSISFFSSWFTI